MSTHPTHDFELDDFQRRAMSALDEGDSVLVAAPTGSGKTVVAEHALAKTLAAGGKAFYTTPIKALSNQKFVDLVRIHGQAQVGLLTGDNAINGDASIVVMTTEVLRNMIYAQSRALDGLLYVVLDEVHFLQDSYRGPVWEEVIIHLPTDVRLVCLSATVSNAAELADWISTVRGPTQTVLEDERPIELINLYCADDKSSEQLHLIPTLIEGRPNQHGEQFDIDRPMVVRGRQRRRFSTPRRIEMIDLLAERQMLPAIYFIFSRAACDDAMRECSGAGISLIEPEERSRITSIVERHVDGLADDDLEVLGYASWLAALESGIAAHHAGMVPPFKEAVEECFAQGLVKVVFATETLALGINMPARTVVIDKLTKFTGERHEFLTPGQYTQLTGRAGRRGIDAIGHAVVLWSPFVTFGQVAELASSRSFVLKSAFHPTYNMAANLVLRYPAEVAHHLLNLSFAQYQADETVVRLESRLAKRGATLEELRARASCELGDVDEFRSLLDADRAAGHTLRDAHNDEIENGLARLKPGDVIWLRGGKNAGRVAVLSVAHRKGGAVRVRAISGGRRVLTLGLSDFEMAPEVVGDIEMPSPFAPHNSGFQRRVSELLNRLPASGRHDSSRDDEVVAHGGAMSHAVAQCPDRDDHIRASRQVARVEREIAVLRREIAGHTESIALTFDRVLQLLDAWGYLDGWALSSRGKQLVSLFHECDLLIAECLAEGLLDDLDAASLAGVVSCFTYEHRSQVPAGEPWFPSAKVRHRVERVIDAADEINADERRSGLPLTRRPDPTFLVLAHAWASGEALDRVLDDEDLSGGDFVRNTKQLIDLLRQIGSTAANPTTARTARDAAERIFRGVVAASSVVGEMGSVGAQAVAVDVADTADVIDGEAGVAAGQSDQDR